jgi:hypothetical protein
LYGGRSPFNSWATSTRSTSQRYAHWCRSTPSGGEFMTYRSSIYWQPNQIYANCISIQLRLPMRLTMEQSTPSLPILIYHRYLLRPQWMARLEYTIRIVLDPSLHLSILTNTLYHSNSHLLDHQSLQPHLLLGIYSYSIYFVIGRHM